MTRRDYTAHTGPIWDIKAEGVKWPMYSYERPSWLFWNGVANELRKQNYSDEQIGEILASKLIRHSLDNFEKELDALGVAFIQRLGRTGWNFVGGPKGATPEKP